MSRHEYDWRAIAGELLLNFKAIDVRQFQVEYQTTGTIGLLELEEIGRASESSYAKTRGFQKAAKGFPYTGIIVDDKD